MRTKALLLSAVLGLTAVSASYAQQVYSVNAVGFVNVTVPKGFSMIANPLDRPPNTLPTIFPADLPEGTSIFKFVPGSGYQTYTWEFGEWTNPNATLSPGEGAFIKNDSAGPIVITFVGEVRQGNDTETRMQVSLPGGFSIASSVVPQALVLSDKDPATGAPNLGFPATDGDTIYFYRNGQYDIHTYEFGEWTSTAGPIPGVGEAFWVNNQGGATVWKRTFLVN